MKRYFLPFLLLVITTAWIIASSLHFHDLNSLQNMAAYRGGLLDKKSFREGKLTKLTGSVGSATVVIDTLGIPHIFGEDPQAVAYAAGYLHARDRYFQMQLLAYTVMGRLSEIIGEEGVSSDQNWKKFGFEEKAKLTMDSIARSDPGLFSYLQAYEKGINDYLSAEDNKHRDPMFLIWDASPKPWKSYYSFLIQWYMSFDLTLYDDYIGRQEILDKLPVPIRNIIYPDRLPDQPTIIPLSEKKDPPPSETAGLVRFFKQGTLNNYEGRPVNMSLGSNNWVVGKSRTRSGQLLLCNDLHLFLTTPNIFYEMQLYCPGLHVYGYSIPGVPLVLTGHNEKIGWGITNGGWDVTEQYLLKIDPRNNDRYWLDGKWETMSTQHFSIQVKNHPPVGNTVKYTVFGPVVTRDSLVYSLCWHPAQKTTAIQSFWKLMKAADWPEFTEALRNYDYPAQNFVYGDINGNIGMICAGKMPVKPAGYNGGLLDGTLSPQWKYLAFDSLPRCYNPSRDYLFSANQDPGQGRAFYSSRWASDLYRPRRIDSMLAKGLRFGVDDMRAMQTDITDLSVNDLQDILARYGRQHTITGIWKQMLSWDGQLQAQSKEAIFYKVFRYEASLSGQELAGLLGVRTSPSFDQFMHFLKDYDTLSFNGRTITAAACLQELMKRTDSIFAANTNPDTTAINPAYSFTIPQMTFLPGFDIQVDNLGGSDNTINVNYGAHPVIRTVIAIGKDGIQSWMVNAIGQNGRVNGKGYTQQLHAWKDNELHQTQFAADASQIRSVNETLIFSKAN